ncbi:MAG TPA: nucleotidyltransferase [Thermoanaerobaculia bacterium]|nr:nucleotidyltransferase [Thermoanaerobaculia bacterium]
MKLLARVITELDSAAIPCALIGAGAMAVHGVSRATFDLDLLTVEKSVLDLSRWIRLREEDVSVDVRRGDSEDPLAGVVRLEAPGDRSVDLIVGRFDWQRSIVDRAERVRIDDVVLRVVRAADLILLKLFAGGTQDVWDIEQVLAVGDRKKLVAEVEKRLEDLPPDSSDLWRRIREG